MELIILNPNTFKNCIEDYIEQKYCFVKLNYTRKYKPLKFKIKNEKLILEEINCTRRDLHIHKEPSYCSSLELAAISCLFSLINIKIRNQLLINLKDWLPSVCFDSYSIKIVGNYTMTDLNPILLDRLETIHSAMSKTFSFKYIMRNKKHNNSVKLKKIKFINQQNQTDLLWLNEEHLQVEDVDEHQYNQNL